MKRPPFLIYDRTEGIANPPGSAPVCQGDQPGKKRVNRWDAVTDGYWRSEVGQRGLERVSQIWYNTQEHAVRIRQGLSIVMDHLLGAACPSILSGQI